MIQLMIGIVKETTISTNRSGGVPVRLATVELTDPQDLQTIQIYTKNGEDYNPAPGSKIAVLYAGRAWGIGIAIDDEILPEAEPGEKYIYALDPTGSAIVASIKLLNTGSVEIAGLSEFGKISINEKGTIRAENRFGFWEINELTGQFNVNDNFTVDV